MPLRHQCIHSFTHLSILHMIFEHLLFAQTPLAGLLILGRLPALEGKAGQQGPGLDPGNMVVAKTSKGPIPP